MADSLVERLTGQATAEAVPVQINLVMTDESLLTGEREPAQVQGFGPLPATLARRLVKQAPQDARRVRRLFTSPTTGQLIAMESKARLFPPALAEFLVIRDQTCRTPWCDAPIRHADHVVDAAAGGPTKAVNGQSLCEACNHTKTLRGWGAKSGAEPGPHLVHTTTPTGHTYSSRAPNAPGFRGGAGGPPPPPNIRNRPPLPRLVSHSREVVTALK
jgi:hypothetical protein